MLHRGQTTTVMAMPVTDGRLFETGTRNQKPNQVIMVTQTGGL